MTLVPPAGRFGHRKRQRNPSKESPYVIPEATVRTRFFRARSLLREALSQEIDLAFGGAFDIGGRRCDRIVAGVMARLAAGEGDL